MDRQMSFSPSIWLGLAGGFLVLTVPVYFRYGFESGFLPLLCGIYAARRGLASRTTVASNQSNGGDKTSIAERHEIETNHEYSVVEQTELLTEVRSEYRRKHRLWGGLMILCVVVAIIAVFTSVALALSSAVVAGYCGFRWYRVRQALSALDTRLDALANAP
jgi:hypothetical protein